jgi:hypothetical protein
VCMTVTRWFLALTSTRRENDRSRAGIRRNVNYERVMKVEVHDNVNE